LGNVNDLCRKSLTFAEQETLKEELTPNKINTLDYAVKAEMPEPSLINYLDTDRRNMTYDDRRRFYGCPYDDDTIESWMHFIFQRDGSLKKFNKLVEYYKQRFASKGQTVEIEQVLTNSRFHYKLKFVGIDKYFD
jgi:hypothetical protein